MRAYKSGLKTLIYFDDLLPNREYKISIVTGEYGTPIITKIKTDHNGELIPDEMTQYIDLFMRIETHGGERD